MLVLPTLVTSIVMEEYGEEDEADREEHELD